MGRFFLIGWNAFPLDGICEGRSPRAIQRKVARTGANRLAQRHGAGEGGGEAQLPVATGWGGRDCWELAGPVVPALGPPKAGGGGRRYDPAQQKHPLPAGLAAQPGKAPVGGAHCDFPEPAALALCRRTPAGKSLRVQLALESARSSGGPVNKEDIELSGLLIPLPCLPRAPGTLELWFTANPYVYPVSPAPPAIP